MNLKSLRAFLLSGTVVFTAMTAFAGGVITTTVNRQTDLPDPGDPEHVEKEEPKHRMPGMPIPCTIDPACGIQFTGQETPDFILYEIYDCGGNCVGAYGDENDFMDALFTMNGEFSITLTSNNAVYTGYVIP